MAVARFILAAIVACSLVSMASAIAGSATYYTPPYVPSSCYGFEDRGTLIAAANPALFANRAACGRRYRIRCVRSTNSIPACRGAAFVDVTIVDLCPGCGADQIDLSQEAFNMIADPAAGRIITDYAQI